MSHPEMPPLPEELSPFTKDVLGDGPNEYERLREEAQRELYEDTLSKRYLGMAGDVLESFTGDNFETTQLKHEAGMELIEAYGQLGEVVKARELVDQFASGGAPRSRERAWCLVNWRTL